MFFRRFSRNKQRVAAAAHVYYEHLWPELADCLRYLPDDATLFVTVSGQGGIERDVLAEFPAANVLSVENIGRDVAPFVSLLPKLMEFDVVCKLHTKRNISGTGEWREGLLHGVAGSRKTVSLILNAFERDPRLALAGARQWYVDGRRFIHGNQSRLAELEPDLPERYGFFAGTMMWLRPSLVADFPELLSTRTFVPHSDEDSQLEHAIERLIGVRAAMRGSRVALVSNGDSARPRLRIVPADRAWK